MAARRIQFPVGSRRISRFDHSVGANATKDVRAQAAALEKAFSNLIADIPAVTEQAIRAGLQPIYDLSQTLVPVKTGKLKASGFLQTRSSDRGASGVVGYGAAGDPFYAAIVHERLDLAHKAPTQAKYLEEPVKRLADGFQERVVKHMKVSLGLGM